MTRSFWPLRLALVTSVACVFSETTFAQSNDAGVDIDVSEEATKNPYLTETSGSWYGAGTLEVRPWVQRTNERDTWALRGLARVRGFTSRYDPETAFGADLSINSRLDARTSAYGAASVYTSNRRTPFDVLGGRRGVTEPVVTPPTPGPQPNPTVIPPIDDFLLLGSDQRTTTSSISAGLSQQLDLKSTASVNVGYTRLDSNTSVASPSISYQSASLGASYSRQVSERTQLGLSVTASKTKYEDNRPSADTFSASATLSKQLSRYWSLNASAGVSVTDAKGNTLFPGYHSVAPVATIGVCNQPPNTKLCLDYSRSQEPSYLGDVRTTDAVSATYSQRLSQRSRADLSASYSRSESASNTLTSYPNLENFSLHGTYSRTLNDRVEGYVTAGIAKTYGGFLSRDPSINFGVGVRLRLGAKR